MLQCNAGSSRAGDRIMKFWIIGIAAALSLIAIAPL
jgi:hypothetical protein